MEDASTITCLYRALLELATASDLDPLLDDVLRLLVERTNATACYLELHIGSTEPKRYAYPAEAPDEAIDHRRHLVLVVPVRAERHLGVLSLSRADAAASFGQADTFLATLAAAQLALVADRFACAGSNPLGDALRTLQEQRIRRSLVRHHGNVSEAARELRVARTLIYRVLARSRSKKAKL